MTTKNFITIAVIAFISGSVYLFHATFAGAVQPVPFKVICHHNPGNNVTLEFVNEQSYTGHLGTPHSDTVFDTDGACIEPTEEPTPTGEPSVTPEVTATPSATLTPTDTPSTSSGGVDPNSCVVKDCSVHPKPASPVVVPAEAPATGRG